MEITVVRVLVRVNLSNALDKATKKFFHLYEGPYAVAKKLDNNAFNLVRLSDGREIGTYHSKRSSCTNENLPFGGRFPLKIGPREYLPILLWKKELSCYRKSRFL